MSISQEQTLIQAPYPKDIEEKLILANLKELQALSQKVDFFHASRAFRCALESYDFKSASFLIEAGLSPFYYYYGRHLHNAIEDEYHTHHEDDFIDLDPPLISEYLIFDVKVNVNMIWQRPLDVKELWTPLDVAQEFSHPLAEKFLKRQKALTYQEMNGKERIINNQFGSVIKRSTEDVELYLQHGRLINLDIWFALSGLFDNYSDHLTHSPQMLKRICNLPEFNIQRICHNASYSLLAHLCDKAWVHGLKTEFKEILETLIEIGDNVNVIHFRTQLSILDVLKELKAPELVKQLLKRGAKSTSELQECQSP